MVKSERHNAGCDEGDEGGGVEGSKTKRQKQKANGVAE
jgi:hypothetical protein